jgi:hypothetical protein
MPLFRATIKSTKLVNGIRLEKGMTVDFPSSYGSPLAMNGGKEVVEAFLRKYGVDIKKANAVSSSYIDVKKIS